MSNFPLFVLAGALILLAAGGRDCPAPLRDDVIAFGCHQIPVVAEGILPLGVGAELDQILLPRPCPAHFLIVSHTVREGEREVQKRLERLI